MTQFNNAKYKAKSPCLNCIDREIGCHSRCDRYKQFRNEIDDEKQVVRDCKAQHNAHMAFLKQQRERHRKQHR